MTYEQLQHIPLWVLLHLPNALFWWGLRFLLIAKAIAHQARL